MALAAGLAFALRASWPALTDRYVVHDDARQHLFWVPRLHDPTLFPNDPIAQYYADQATPGFSAIYWLGTLLVDPILFNKLLPLLLTASLVVLTYALATRLFARNQAGLFAALLAAWLAWWFDDLSSGAARAFTAPLLTAFLLCLAARRRLLALLCLALGALLYPVACLLMLGTQALWDGWWLARLYLPQPLLEFVARGGGADGRGQAPTLPGMGETDGRGQVPTLSGTGEADGRGQAPRLPGGGRGVRVLLWLVAGTALVGVLTFPTRQAGEVWGPLVTAEQARRMPEFQQGGRASYFISDPYRFWVESTRSGMMLRGRDDWLFGLPAQVFPAALIAAAGLWTLTSPSVPGGAGPPWRGFGLPLALLAASAVLFAAAHLLLFRLYLPARYLQFSLLLILSLGGGSALALLTEQARARLAPRTPGRHFRRAFAIGTALLLLALLPPADWFITGRTPALYEYLHSLPPQARVAALPGDSGSIPLFSQRSVLVSREHALPYHLGYYEPLKIRTEELQRAYFARSPEPIVRLAEREGAEVIVANLGALAQRRESNREPLGLEQLAERCGALRERGLVAIPLTCAREALGR